jgi:hypothetical protein
MSPRECWPREPTKAKRKRDLLQATDCAFPEGGGVESLLRAFNVLMEGISRARGQLIIRLAENLPAGQTGRATPFDFGESAA